MNLFCAVGLALAVSLFLGPSTRAAEVLPGPVAADVVRVIDGDTLDVLARVWLGQTVQVRVRLDGVDAPELRGRCAGERAQAEEVRAWLVRQLAGHSLARRPVRRAAYDCVTCLNKRHKLFARMSLTWVGFSDVAVRLCAMDVWTNVRLF